MDRTSWGDTEVAPWPALGCQPEDMTATERRREGQILPPPPLTPARSGHQRKSPILSGKDGKKLREEEQPMQRPFKKAAGFSEPVEEAVGGQRKAGADEPEPTPRSP